MEAMNIQGNGTLEYIEASDNTQREEIGWQ